MTIKSYRKGNEITIHLKEEFGYSGRDKLDFKDIFTNQPGDKTKLSYVIDFQETKYISSNGAGLLNSLRSRSLKSRFSAIDNPISGPLPNVSTFPFSIHLIPETAWKAG